MANPSQRNQRDAQLSRKFNQGALDIIGEGLRPEGQRANLIEPDLSRDVVGTVVTKSELPVGRLLVVMGSRPSSNLTGRQSRGP